MSTETISEARRQIEICNACRYCEGYCSVFPAINRERKFSDGDVIQLANLCHNCRGCYYACQYTEPHEFELNLPRVFAEVRQQSWQQATAPSILSSIFQRSGIGIVLVVLLSVLLFLITINSSQESEAATFYDLMSHNAMVAVFSVSFLLPLCLIFISLRRYWQTIGAGPLRLTHIMQAASQVANMKDLSGGHGDGCNFEDEDRFSNLRRWLHQSVLYGFVLCFAATSVATLMHYFFAMPAPYSFWSLPKLLGVSGGVMLSFGSLGMAVLKTRGDQNLSDASVWNGEMAFVLLLFLVSTSGLALYLASRTAWLDEMLILHLASVFAFFLLTPFSKMIHGFYRLASIIRDVQQLEKSRGN